MTNNLPEGIHFNLNQNDKFKNIAIAIDFVEPIKENHLEQRTMVAEMLENYSEKYDSKLKVARKLAAMYGATFGANVFKVGNQAVLRIFISFINDKFLPDDVKLIEQIADFLKEMIFYPLIINDSFPVKQFELQRDNLVEYLFNLNDNKKYYAARETKKLFFENDTDNAKMVFGDLPALAKLKARETADYFQKMISENEIYISVDGDVENEDVQPIVDLFRLNDRKHQVVLMNSHEDLRSEKNVEKKAQQKQSQLDFAFNFPVSIKSEDYFAAIIFNAMFGGSPSSLMFTNIREENSLAYYISSSFNSTLGFILVQSGIDGENDKKVIELVKQQRDKLINGDYSDELLNKIKKTMVNSYLTKYDSQRQMLNTVFINSLLNREITIDEWIKKIKSISKTDISSVAQKAELKTTFLLEGETDE
ncbi:insulinase family protein [Fructilactobacillus vespulae]|uniref:EF-P 5-aminopentanol modification-associated protein YfmF n=1 Tax=Fructilactobacillus vespulae TaxID=1249630 RepID=UPI0039B379AA